MKTLQNYITSINEEANSSWIEEGLKKMQEVNSEDIKSVVLLYNVRFDDYYQEIWDGYGRLFDKFDATKINKAYVNAAVTVDVVTTDKGNFYGVTKNNVSDKPALAKCFNKRVKGTKGHVWTNDINNIKVYLETLTKNLPIDVTNPVNENYYRIYYTTVEKAKAAAQALSKKHKLDVTVVWHNNKIKQLQELIKQRQANIDSFKEHIKRLEEEINDIKDDIIEYENMKNVSSEDFNESLEKNN